MRDQAPSLVCPPIGGVDPWAHHHAAIIDQHGRLFGDCEVAANSRGDQQLVGWLGRHGQVRPVAAAGTSSYGAGLTQVLVDEQVTVATKQVWPGASRRWRPRSPWPTVTDATARLEP